MDDADLNQPDATEGIAWVLIGSFDHGMDLALVEARFDDEGIEFRKSDENTVQVAPYLSAAIGGVRLYVRADRTSDARMVLADLGLLPMDDDATNPLLKWLSQKSLVFPFLRSSGLHVRLLFLGAVIALAVTAIVFVSVWLSAPTKAELLTESNWCVQSIVHDNVTCELVTMHSGLWSVWLNCDQPLWIRTDGSITFPGVHTTTVRAGWRVDDGQLVVEYADRSAEVFNGHYSIEIGRDRVRLTSERTVIIARRLRGF